MEEQLICLEENDECQGFVEYRMALSGTGKAFPRCEFHWDKRLEKQEEHNTRYPVMPPHDFDPGFAGERWDED